MEKNNSRSPEAKACMRIYDEYSEFEASDAGGSVLAAWKLGRNMVYRDSLRTSLEGGSPGMGEEFKEEKERLVGGPAHCGCAACNPNASWMVLCQVCGNKRCPHASNHEFPCTGSNEPNQPGSRYSVIPHPVSWSTSTRSGPTRDQVRISELEEMIRERDSQLDDIRVDWRKYRTALNRIAHPGSYGINPGHHEDIAARALVLGRDVDPLSPGASNVRDE